MVLDVHLIVSKSFHLFFSPGTRLPIKFDVSYMLIPGVGGEPGTDSQNCSDHRDSPAYIIYACTTLLDAHLVRYIDDASVIANASMAQLFAFHGWPFPMGYMYVRQAVRDSTALL